MATMIMRSCDCTTRVNLGSVEFGSSRVGLAIAIRCLHITRNVDD
jgi:hypothetical protein